MTDVEFTASLDGKNIQLINTETGMYTIYVQDAPLIRGNGMRMVDEDIQNTELMAFANYTLTNLNAQAPDDSVWLVSTIPGTDGMMRLTNTYNTDFILGNGGPSGGNGHNDYWHNHQSHPEWASQTGGQDYGGAAEFRPNGGMVLEHIGGTEDQYLVSFPSQDNEPQYLLLLQPTESSAIAFLCRKDKMGDFTFDTNNILTGTLEEKSYKLATFTLKIVVPPIDISEVNYLVS